MKLELHEPGWLSMGATIRAYRLYRTDDLAICINCSEVAENRGRPTYSGHAVRCSGRSCRSSRVRQFLRRTAPEKVKAASN